MKAKHIIIIVLSLLAFVACDKEEIIVPTIAPRTVLVYFAGDNSLSGYVNENLTAIKEGMEQDGLNNGNLLVYTADRSSAAPQLFQLRLEADTVRQILIETYDPEQSSATTETLTQVIDKVQTEYPADGYGLVLWSHGTGWLPSNVRSYLRSFGQDGNNNFIEINDLASALSKYHFDFLLFDACYMACAEVVYALRECADYIIASPTEILAEGFPYQSIIGDMFKEEADVVGIATKFYTRYQNQAGTISVTKCDALDELAATCRTIFQDKTESDLFAIPASELQIMEYLTPNYHALYDFDDYISHLATEEQYDTFKQSLEKAVIYKATTPKAVYAYPSPYGSYLPVNKYCGLSIYVPQEALPELNEWYKDLAWYQVVLSH